MKPAAKPRTYEQPLISTMRLDLTLDMAHPLVRRVLAVKLLTYLPLPYVRTGLIGS